MSVTLAQGKAQGKSGFAPTDIIAAVGAVVIIGMMVIPMPGWLLDGLIGINLTMALTILLVVMYTVNPLDFSSFPSVLLLVTLFRLALNISATRLILLHAEAGSIISAFGSVVVGGNYVVGLVVFIILVIINFVVITNGAGRVAEVAARFTLDAMPGKQMAIDADLNAGLIDEEEAKARRQKISQESDFYGAMDGASKFVRGDAIAAVVMIVINIIGGFTVGIVQHQMDLTTAIQTYTILTIGDGLVTQIPALLISTATGLIVTRAVSDVNLGRNLSIQILGQPKALGTAGGIIIALGLVPGIPKLPFITVGVLVAIAAMMMSKPAPVIQEAEAAPEVPKAPENLAALVGVDPLELEIGYGLISIADRKQNGELLDRITALRRQLAVDSGMVVPPIRVRDNLQLKPQDYSIRLKGVEAASGSSYPGQYLAMNPAGGMPDIPGIQTTDPAFGLPAVWISESDRPIAESMGCTIVDSTTVIITHLSEFIKAHAGEIITRQDVQNILDSIKEKAPAVVDELIPNVMTVGEVQRVLARLLDERVDIRDTISILETLGDWAKLTKDIDILVERVRERLGRLITKQYQEADGKLYVFTLDPYLERYLSESLKQTESGLRCIIDPGVLQRILVATRDEMERLALNGRQPVALVAPPIRIHFRRLVERNFPQLAVLSFNEIASGVSVESTGMVTVTDENSQV